MSFRTLLKFEGSTKLLNSILYTYVSFESVGAKLYQKNARQKKSINFTSRNILLILCSKTGSYKMLRESISVLVLQV